MAEKLVEKGVGQDRVSVIRNWVDLSHIFPLEGVSPYRAELGFSGEDFVVLYSGNIGAKQGLGVLLDAAEKLRDERGIKFVVAGEGPVKNDLQAKYAQLENVRFLPFQPYSRLNEFLNMADLHALPQDKGAADLVLPSKLGGMLASGKQVLVTAEKGTELAEFVDNIGLVVEPGDAGAMAEAILHCAKQGELPSGSREEALGRLSREAGLKEIVSAVAPACHA
ncbi:glycosyltransferase [Aliirhizobium terrae]|uniref:glycosyltransferase n=1 Tax=Terrirhizobium terrae TaxID=2926709 RepID=UPI00336A18F7